MKRLLLLLTMSLVIFTANAYAVFNSGSTGADGPFNPAASPPQVPPSTVINGTTATVPLPANGIFNFTTVNIPTGWTVKFSKNATNTPVYILATGDVTIAGTINIAGGNGLSSGVSGAGGPGGYDGGFGGGAYTAGGKGQGPGGGAGATTSCSYGIGSGGGYGETGKYTGANCGPGGPVYGNARLQPLIGGSGGGGGAGSTGVAGGAGGGGGAILVASSGNISLTGSVKADGGDGYNPCGGYTGGGGSGGAIRLVANAISGSGTITAKGGMLVCSQRGGYGRVRLEAYTNSSTSSDPAYTYGLPGSVFPVHEPILRISAVAGVSVPANPTGSYAQPDIMLPNTTANPVAVALSASYIPIGTTVTVSVIPQYGSEVNATTSLSGTEASSTGVANVNLSTQYSNVIMATATYVMQQAMYWEGEKIEKVRVASAIGKDSETVYITESGKEIMGKELVLAGLLK